MPKKQTAKNKSKRVLIVADTHCGHLLGLTPPQWRSNPAYKEIQKVGWDFYTEQIKKLGHIDLCLCNGDLIDGPDVFRSREYITDNTEDQVKMAIECVEAVKADKYVFVRGTPVHVKTDRENENEIARHFKGKIGDELKLDVNGCIIHARHTTGKSGTVYGSATSLQRSALVQLLNDEIDGNEKANIYVRSHAHEYVTVDRSICTACISPCLQFKGSSFGRKCTGFYDYGLMWFDINPDGHFKYDKEILTLSKKYRKQEVIKI